MMNSTQISSYFGRNKNLSDLGHHEVSKRVFKTPDIPLVPFLVLWKNPQVYRNTTANAGVEHEANKSGDR